MSTPSLSVIIPCYNAEATLGDQLAALAGQSWDGDWEVIVADNGSTDGSRQVAESFRDRLPHLKVVAATGKGGPGHARNAGAAAARGEILLFCDADDEVAPGWVAALGAAVREHGLAASRYALDKLNPARVRGIHEHAQETGLNPYTYPPYLPHAGGGGLGVLRRLHESVGGFDETLPALEDTDYCWRLQRVGTPLVFVPDAVVQIRFRPDLRGAFRQAFHFGVYNVWIYQRYRPLGMPRLPWTAGLRKWGALLLRTPGMLLTATGRGRWLRQIGWRLGRVRGCWKFRVFAP